MSRKLELEKLVWKWTETVKPEEVAGIHVETAYRLHLPVCHTGSCRKNCKGNPRCFECLGAAEWEKEYDDAIWTDVEDPDLERRKKDSYVGLKNLGATCYVNSLLQLWFHNIRFRKAIYDWVPIDGDDEGTQEEDGEAECRPKSCVGQLQCIFALLQFSNRRFIDPSPFIKSLGLNTTEQQDAQEFSKLFVSLLEDKLKTQEDPSVRNIVQEQFRGEYDYVTRCCKCVTVSKCHSTFYELDLNVKGNKNLHGCIQEFLNEEKLEGSNQYFCNNCRSKENATRSIKLGTLPPVLNLQLLRFVFDRQKNQKKKLQTVIKFPEVLDMNQYVDGSDGTLLYDLNAVLVHCGRSAYSGHYVAHIRDCVSGSWFMFNDEDIEKIAGKSLKLVKEESGEGDDVVIVNEGSSKTNGRPCKGQHRSGDAYMLVYHLRNKKTESLAAALSLNWEIPEHLQEVVAIDNSSFDEWAAEISRMRAKNVQTGKQKQVEVLSLFKILPCSDVTTDWEWISAEWLITWLRDNAVVPPVSITSDRCPHQRLHPDSIVNLKCVTKTAANQLREKYGGELQLGRESLCVDCVVSRCRYLRLKSRMRDDYKLIMDACRAKINNESAFWVGKASLRCWRKLALKCSEDHGSNYAQSTKNAIADEDTVGHCGGDEMEEADDDTENGEICRFNDDIVCQHGELTITESCRRLVPRKAWLCLKTYFPFIQEFSASSLMCSFCKDETADVQHVREYYRTLASEQRIRLHNLYMDRNRPQLDKLVDVEKHYYAVSTDFVKLWRKFIRAPSRQEPIMDVFNNILLCSHGGLLYMPNLTSSGHLVNDSTEDKIVLLQEPEWKEVCAIFQVDSEISVTVSPAEVSGCPPVVTLSPEFCVSCSETRLKEEAKELFVYSHAIIFVCKISADEESGCSLAKVCEDPIASNENSTTKNGDNFTQVTKRKRLNEMTTAETDLFVRRSSRHRKAQGEKSLTVTSTQTLRDLKLEIMKNFSVAPFDQHLTLNGAPLEASDATLGELGIIPGCVIQLRVDEPSDEILGEEVSIPEEGFKGTELLRS